MVKTLTPEVLEDIWTLNSPNENETVEVPEHLTALFATTEQTGLSLGQRQQLDALLQKYKETFSMGSHDQGPTDLVEHKISFNSGANTIRQQARRLGH